MTPLRIPHPPLNPISIAGLGLAARQFFRDLDLPHPTGAALLAATGAGKTRAYEVAGQVLDVLATLERPPGRPAAPTTTRDDDTSPSDVELIANEVIDYLIDHPGCGSGESREHAVCARRAPGPWCFASVSAVS